MRMSFSAGLDGGFPSLPAAAEGTRTRILLLLASAGYMTIISGIEQREGGGSAEGGEGTTQEEGKNRRGRRRRLWSVAVAAIYGRRGETCC